MSSKSGNLRWYLAISLGSKVPDRSRCTANVIFEVPVVQVHHLTPAQVKTLRIADNRLCEKSEWDERLLGEAFQELSLLELDFGLDITGFELPEIDLMLGSLGEPASADEDPADDVPETAAVAISKLGDLWQLGNHRLLCGSAL